jgi:hypothetical protein
VDVWSVDAAAIGITVDRLEPGSGEDEAMFERAAGGLGVVGEA